MENKKTLCVEISDIFEAEQEDFVIDNVGERVGKSREDLKEYFSTTDTVVVKRLTREEADELSSRLENLELSVRIYDMDEKSEEKAKGEIRCPKCGCVLEFQDWRCPECYYEFPDFELGDDNEEDE